LPEAIPDDVDYDWYIAATREMLADIDYLPRPRLAGLFD
jgi:hypothetical protein